MLTAILILLVEVLVFPLIDTGTDLPSGKGIMASFILPSPAITGLLAMPPLAAPCRPEVRLGLAG
jgi:hypothetical protein